LAGEAVGKRRRRRRRRRRRSKVEGFLLHETITRARAQH
jgi:hypothetical protein